MINVIVLDVKGLITQSGHDVVVRHDAYGAALKVLEPNSRRCVIHSSLHSPCIVLNQIQNEKKEFKIKNDKIQNVIK
jgi:hypothetical protein